MHVVHPVCAGIDVHKSQVTVCLVWREGKQRQEEVRTYSTMTPDLLRLSDWLSEHQCPMVALESTGVYWKPVYNVLESEREVMLVNPGHMKQVPGRKTDVKDSQWIAQLLEHGLLRGSFIPPQEVRDLRDLTRYRRQLVHERTREVNRLQKVLEDANLKLGSVATDVMGVSGRLILQAILDGEEDAQKLAELAKGRLRNKKEQLVQALQGRFRPHHAGLLARILGHIDFLDANIAECEAEIEEMCRPFERQIELLCTIPGVHCRAAQDLIAEIGVDMGRFPTHKHLCSWAKMCPGLSESGGKRKNTKIGKGNRWLRGVLIECGHAGGRSKGTYLGAQYRRFAARKGNKHAAVVVGHSILEAVYFILRDGVEYLELGETHQDEINKKQLVSRLVRRLENLGLKVDIHDPSLVA